LWKPDCRAFTIPEKHSKIQKGLVSADARRFKAEFVGQLPHPVRPAFLKYIIARF
jgi:hypothetical protein